MRALINHYHWRKRIKSLRRSNEPYHPFTVDWSTLAIVSCTGFILGFSFVA